MLLLHKKLLHNLFERKQKLFFQYSREGRSGVHRKMYIEAKELHKDKSVQIKELDKYLQELSSDIVEMIEDASNDERSYMEKKIQALASKIGSMNG